jgi:hypothetical protein
MKFFYHLSFLVLASAVSLAQEVLPEDPGIAPVSGEARAAAEGLEMEEGVLTPYVNEGPTEAQQVYENKKAQEDEAVEQEDADSRQMEAEAVLNESLEPQEGYYDEEPTAVVPVQGVLAE